MDDDDDEVFYESRNRFRSDATREEQALSIVRELLKAQAETDPDRGEISAKGKDGLAFTALLRAGDLVHDLAGWALDHVCGVSLVGEKMRPAPVPQVRSSNEYATYSSVVNDHAREALGSKAYHTGETGGRPLSPLQKRALLRNLIFVNSAGFPWWLRDEALEAIDGLEFGHQSPMLAAASRARFVTLKELRAKLKILSIVRFEASVYGGVEKAREKISRICNVDTNTIKGWEPSLLRDLGQIEVRNSLQRAEYAAEWVRLAAERLGQGLAVGEKEENLRNRSLRLYGPAALKNAVEKLNEARTERVAPTKGSRLSKARLAHPKPGKQKTL